MFMLLTDCAASLVPLEPARAERQKYTETTSLRFKTLARKWTQTHVWLWVGVNEVFN